MKIVFSFLGKKCFYCFLELKLSYQGNFIIIYLSVKENDSDFVLKQIQEIYQSMFVLMEKFRFYLNIFKMIIQ